LGGLWVLECAWYIAESNLRCARSSGICMPNLNSLALRALEVSAFIRTDGQTDMARSTRLVILIKNMYTLWGRKRFLLPVTYFPTNLVYPFTIRVTGIKRIVWQKLLKIKIIKIEKRSKTIPPEFYYLLNAE